jgi:isobutyryl-CoA dehydrogenase
LGAAQSALEQTAEYLMVRKQFGKPLADFQHNQFKLAEMATNLVASRLMVRNATHYLDKKLPQATGLCAMAKLFATDQCFDVTLKRQPLFLLFLLTPEKKITM